MKLVSVMLLRTLHWLGHSQTYKSSSSSSGKFSQFYKKMLALVFAEPNHVGSNCIENYSKLVMPGWKQSKLHEDLSPYLGTVKFCYW